MQESVPKRIELELWEIVSPGEEHQTGKNTKAKKSGKTVQTTTYRGRPVQSMKRRKARRRKAIFFRCLAVMMVIAFLAGVFVLTGVIYRWIHGLGKKVEPPVITADYLEINPYSRPGIELKKVKNIFVHYTANPGTTAAQNRSYFANLAQTQERAASAHFIIGYEGEIIQCVPLEEEAYAVATRNEDSISIECCYLAEDGSFTPQTYDTLIHTLAWLIDKYNLSTDDILRHYDCGGKLCPLYYAEHEDAWEQLRQDVADYKNPEDVH